MEAAQKRKAILLKNKKKNEEEKIEFLDLCAHNHYKTCKLASVLSGWEGVD